MYEVSKITSRGRYSLEFCQTHLIKAVLCVILSNTKYLMETPSPCHARWPLVVDDGAREIFSWSQTTY